ncbi:hypothetical protein GCM10020000_43950 [Streptomyces olivoverticillatus]
MHVGLEQEPHVSVPPVLVPPRTTAVAGVVREASVPPLVPPVTRGSLGDLPFDNAAAAPADAVLSRKQPDGTWRDVTAATFAAEVLAVAKGLLAHGLQAGDRLAVMARTRYEWTLLDFAAWAAGLVTVPVYPASSAEQVRWILADSGAVACVVETAEQLRLIAGERRRLPDLAHVWQIEAGAVRTLTDAGRAVPGRAVAERRSARTPDDIATLIYTSGTTGRPKGCVLTHANFFTEADNCTELLHPVFTSVSRRPAATLLFLPLSHVFGRAVAIGCLRARVRLGHTPSLRAEELRADLARLPADLPARHPLRPGEGLQHRPRHRRTAGPRRRLRPGGGRRRGVRGGGHRPPARHRPRARPAAARRPRPLRAAGLPARARRPRRPRPVRHQRRLPAGAAAVRLLHRRRSRGLRGLRADGDHRRRHRHPAAAAPAGHGRLAAARRRGAHSRRRRGAAARRARLRRVLGRQAAAGRGGRGGRRVVRHR